MAVSRECPLCGGTMKIKESQSVTRVPGYPDALSRTTREWLCADCDYFEEADGEDNKEESR